MMTIFAFVAIPLHAILFRCVGGAWFPAAKWIVPFLHMALFYFSGVPWYLAVILAATRISTYFWPHGRWYDLHYLPDGYAREGIPLKFLEKIVCFIVPINLDHLRLGVCIFLSYLPGFTLLMLFIGGYDWWWNVLLGFRLTFLFSCAVLMAYVIGWFLHNHYGEQNPIRVAEIIHGACFGALGVILSI